MKEKIDVVLIGHNEIKTEGHVELYRQTAENTETFRGLDPALRNFDGIPITVCHHS